MSTRRSAIIECALWLSFLAAAYAFSYEFDKPLGNYPLGASGWPRAIILASSVLAITQLLVKLHREKREGNIKSVEAPSEGTPTIKRLLVFLLPFAYAFLFSRAGYFVVTPIFLVSYMILLGEHRIGALVCTTLFIYGSALTLFTWLLYLPLPTGYWPGFYELNSTIVAWLS